MEYIAQLDGLWRRLLTYDVPEHYWVIGAVILLLVTTWATEWLSVGAVNVTVRLFRLGGRRGPVGRELAARMLKAAGERHISVDETTLDTDFRMTFGDMDYQPETGTLELTEDKAFGASIASAGLVTLEVGRALQFSRGFPLIFVRRVAAPFVNFAGFAWIWPSVGANVLPLIAGERFRPEFDWLLYFITASLLGLIGFYLLLKIPIDLDAARRGVAAMKKARVFSFGEAVAIRVFLAVILSATILATVIIALNFLKGTVRTGKR